MENSFISTIICTQTGWYGSWKKWVHAPTAFKNWYKCGTGYKMGDWVFLGNDPEKVAVMVGVADLPKREYEFDEFKAFGIFDDKEN
jgi:hypothetical protein